MPTLDQAMTLNGLLGPQVLASQSVVAAVAETSAGGLGPSALSVGPLPGVTATPDNLRQFYRGTAIPLYRTIPPPPATTTVGSGGTNTTKVQSVVNNTTIVTPTFVAFTVPFSANPTFDLANGNIQTITLSGDVLSSSIIGATTNGETLELRIIENVVGGWIFNWPTTIIGANVFQIATGSKMQTNVALRYNGVGFEFTQPLVSFQT